MIGWIGWALLAAALVGLSAGAATGRIERPGPLVDAAVSRPAIRLVVVLSWMWVGWHLFAR